MNLVISFNSAFGIVGFGLLHDLGFEGISSQFSEILDVLSFNNFGGLSLRGLNLCNILLGLHLNFSLEEIDLFNILVVLEGHQSLDVISLKSQESLVLVVIDDEHSVLLLLDLLLEEHIESSGLHQSKSEVNRENDVHDIDLLNNYTVWVELGLKFSHHGGCEFRLNISNSGNLDLLKEISDLLFALFLQELLKSVWTEVVKELTGIFLESLLTPSNMEVDTDIDRHSNIVLGWNLSNWASETDGVLCDHDGDLLVVAVAASVSGFHDTLINTAALLEDMHSLGYVQLGNTAR